MAHGLEELSQELKRECEFLKHEDFSLSKLTGDASSRSYFHIQGKQSYILQVNPDFEVGRRFLSVQAMWEQASIAVPKIYFVHPYKGWIVMTDLGDCSLQDCVEQNAENPLRVYREALDLILKWNLNVDFASEAYLAKFDIEALIFDFHKLHAEMAYTAEYLIRRYWQQGEFYDKFLTGLTYNSEFLAERARCFCHRDCNARNIMVSEGKMVAIDFQDGRKGPLSYDVVSLLWDPYVRLSESNIKELYAYWYEQLQRHLNADWRSSLKDLGEEVERMKIQRFLKAAGSFASFKYRKSDAGYLAWIDPAITVVKSSLACLLADYDCSDRQSLEELQNFLTEMVE